MKNFFSQSFSINNKKIGNNYPVFIVAEAGVNHDGNLKKALKLVDFAKKAGADAIKFQTFNTNASTAEDLKKANYQKKNTKDKETQFEMLKKLELSYYEHIKIKKYCDKKKIIFFSTPSDIESVKLLKKLNVSCYKISSVDLNNFELIKEICSTKKPVIISTGMSNENDIFETKKRLERWKNKKIVFLHCVSSYPTNILDLNLNSIKFIRKKIKSLVGFSDHSLGFYGAVLSVACGACVIEKHITLNKNFNGPDHKISMNFFEFKKIVQKIREVEKILGKKKKKLHNSEKNTLSVTKKVFFAKKDFKVGAKLRLNMLYLKSAGKGLDYKTVRNFLGKKFQKKINKDDLIKSSYFYEI